MNIYQVINAFSIVFGLASLLQTVITAKVIDTKSFKIYRLLHLMIIVKQIIFYIKINNFFDGIIVIFLHITDYILISSIFVTFILLQSKIVSMPVKSSNFNKLLFVLIPLGGLFYILSYVTEIRFFDIFLTIYYYIIFLSIAVRGLYLNSKSRFSIWYNKAKIIYLILILLTPFLVFDEAFLFYLKPQFYYTPMILYLFLNIVSSIMLIFILVNRSNLQKKDNEKAKRLLTAREYDIALEVTKGLTYQEIADKKFVSHSTVKTHLYNIYKKLGVRNKVELSELINSK